MRFMVPENTPKRTKNAGHHHTLRITLGGDAWQVSLLWYERSNLRVRRRNNRRPEDTVPSKRRRTLFSSGGVRSPEQRHRPTMHADFEVPLY